MSDIIRTPRPGEIWQLRFSSLLGVIVCAWTQEGEADDIRVVPIELGDSAVRVSTGRDVVLGADDSSLGTPTVARAWNARTICASDLVAPFGNITAAVLEVVREAEMIGIVPDLDESLHEWLGPVGDATEPEREAALLLSLRLWDDALDLCNMFRDADGVAMDRRQFTGRSMTRAEILQSEPVDVMISLTNTGNFRLSLEEAEQKLLSEAA